MDEVIKLEDVSCRFDDRGPGVTALDAVNLEVMAGTFVAVMGATGSGKSTLLNCAAALDRPSAGTIRLLGHDVTTMSEPALSRLRRDHVGFVFQSYNLLSELTVAQNVLIPCRLGARQARPVAEVLGSVGLGGAEARAVAELSGGERQRVAIARALVTAPQVIFADEPTGALDPTTGRQVLSLLRDAVDKLRTTVVMVTHDPAAAAFSDRLVLLRTGRIVENRSTPDASLIAHLLHEVSTQSVGAGS